MAIAEKEGGDNNDDEPITLELVCELVAASADKNAGVEIVKEPESSLSPTADDYKDVCAPVKRLRHPRRYEARKKG